MVRHRDRFVLEISPNLSRDERAGVLDDIHALVDRHQGVRFVHEGGVPEFFEETPTMEGPEYDWEGVPALLESLLDPTGTGEYIVPGNTEGSWCHATSAPVGGAGPWIADAMRVEPAATAAEFGAEDVPRLLKTTLAAASGQYAVLVSGLGEGDEDAAVRSRATDALGRSQHQVIVAFAENFF